jgi:hypothetical protein
MAPLDFKRMEKMQVDAQVAMKAFIGEILRPRTVRIRMYRWIPVPLVFEIIDLGNLKDML